MVFENSGSRSGVIISSTIKSEHLEDLKIGGSVFFAEIFKESESLPRLNEWRKFVHEKIKSENRLTPEVIADDDDEEGPEVQLIVVRMFESEAAKNEALQWALKFSNYLLNAI
jgi:hypothetical protein